MTTDNHAPHFAPVYILGSEIWFPNLLDEPDLDDLVAIGGDLSPERIIEAYKSGLFPWFVEDGEPYWFSPNPRMILYPHKFKISKSLAKSIKNSGFEVRFGSDFAGVMRACALPRKQEKTSWITSEYISAYEKLHKQGLAESVECYLDGELVGGLYGVVIEKVFFGESMFASVKDASKVAFRELCNRLISNDFAFVDCQVPSDHLASLGGELIGRNDYINLLKEHTRC